MARDGDCAPPEAAAGLERTLDADPGVGALLPAAAVADAGDDGVGGSGEPMMLGWVEGTRQGGRAGLGWSSVEAL